MEEITRPPYEATRHPIRLLEYEQWTKDYSRTKPLAERPCPKYRQATEQRQGRFHIQSLGVLVSRQAREGYLQAAKSQYFPRLAASI